MKKHLPKIAVLSFVVAYMFIVFWPKETEVHKTTQPVPTTQTQNQPAQGTETTQWV